MKSNFEREINDELKCINVLGDGNCFYRALSVCLTGDENNHLNIRKLMAEFYFRNYDFFKGIIGEEN